MRGSRWALLWLVSVVLYLGSASLQAQNEEVEILINMRPLTLGQARVYRDLGAQVETAELLVEVLEDLLTQIDDSPLSDGAKSFLRGGVAARMSEAGEPWLLDLVESDRTRLRGLAIGALGSRALSDRAASVLLDLVGDETTDAVLRVSALSILGTSDHAEELSKESLRSLVDSKIEDLSGTAAWFLVHPECSLDGTVDGPDAEFEAVLSGWLADADRHVRLAAATCLLQWGGFGWYRPNHPVVERAVRVVGWDVLDSSLAAAKRGDALRDLSGWLGSREARRVVGEMLEEENWFFWRPRATRSGSQPRCADRPAVGRRGSSLGEETTPAPRETAGRAEISRGRRACRPCAPGGDKRPLRIIVYR